MMEAVSEARVARALGVSGRRMLMLADGRNWGVLQGGDRRRRPVLKVADTLVRTMAGAGRLAPAEGGGWVLAGRIGEADCRDGPALSLATLMAAAGAPRSHLRGVGFAGLALKAGRGEGALSLREAAAGRRLIADVEAAMRMPGLTMDWDAAPGDRGGRAAAGAGRGGPGGAGAGEALRRLERLEAATGERAFALCRAACVDGTPLAVLEQRFGLVRRSAGRRLSEALEKLADAYEK
jgi:hypothetical protein